MSNLLLITDVARLRKVFGRLTEDKNIRLRIVNNLEKGGEELTIEKPDVVFVQTHLSGLSADILLMHLKKQLGRKRTRFVLLASPAQTSDAILKPYQGWLDTSVEDGPLLSELHRLLATLLSKPKKDEEPAATEITSANISEQSLETSVQPDAPAVSEPASPQQVSNNLQFPVVAPAPEPSLEEQGITYAPRQRLTVYSEFNSSFDSAVNSTPEPETLEQATPVLSHDWNAETIDTVEATPIRSKRRSFLLWLVPVVIVVVVITLIQQQKSAIKPEPAKTTSAPAAVAKSAAVPAPVPAVPQVDPAKMPVAASPAVPQEQDRMSDKAVLSAIAENRTQKSAPEAAPSGSRLTVLPAFIPRNGFDKQFSAANPGWERYKGQVTEFKVLRQGQAIKAIQIIDRGGNGVPESFMKGVLNQVTKKTALRIDSTEKKEGYEIQRGRVAENIRAVYYRDETSGKLQAFVLTWQ